MNEAITKKYIVVKIIEEKMAYIEVKLSFKPNPAITS
jgi:hypothetical protein